MVNIPCEPSVQYTQLHHSGDQAVTLCHTKTRFNKNSRKLALFQIFIIKERLNNDDCIPSPLLMFYLKEILYEVLDWNNAHDSVLLLLDDCELDNLPDMVIQ